jgi:hypothetical protein
MWRHFERWIRRPCCLGDEIGGSVEAAQVDAEMQQPVIDTEGKLDMSPRAHRFTR